ncbi:MAG TPA: hypothetical protein VNP72_09605 [Longimicrobium sp.]|nr:hypothetical protein [Longimicrobium sp.]
MRRAFLRRAWPAAVLVLAAACSDITGDAGARVAGLTLEDGSGNVLASVSGSSVSGSVSVADNSQRTLYVVLRDDSGAEVSPGIADFVRVTVTNTQVAGWSDQGGGAGTLEGRATGTTTLRVDLLSAGIATYTSPAITVSVN